MEWSCQLLTLPEPVIQSMNFWRLSLPFEYWLFLALTMTVFKFKKPECHLQNQVGKRSNSNNFANLGNTKKVWCDKNDITSCYFWLCSFLPDFQPCQFIWNHRDSEPETCWENPGILFCISCKENDSTL